MWNPFDFTGKRFVIAGATSGMGKATAIKLSQQGAEVCLIGRSQDKLNEVKKELSSDSCRCYVKDFSEPGGFQEIFDDIVADGKKIDGLVYCAGMAKILPVSMLSKKNMDESMTVNLYSFAEMVSVLSKKKYHDKASVVGISSISSLYPQKQEKEWPSSKSGSGSRSVNGGIN